MNLASSAVVDSSCPYASQVALDVMQAGGTAADAAIAASAVLFVTLPMCCGPGGDLAAICFDAASRKVLSHTAFGRTPQRATREFLASLGHKAVPRIGIMSATIPAAAEGLVSMHHRMGTRPLEELFEPAITAARDGVVVTGQMHKWIKNNITVIKDDETCSAIFLPGGKAIQTGSILRQPQLGAFLDKVARGSASYLQSDEYRNAVLQFTEKQGGLFSLSDFEQSQVDIHEPITLRLGEHTVHTNPAPSQGAILLRNLAMYDFAVQNSLHTGTNRIHVWREIFNQTYNWRLRALGDLDAYCTDFWLEDLPGDCSAIKARHRSQCLYKGHYSEGDTTQFVVGDKVGNSVSMILSLSLGFGSGVAEPSTGIIFNSRLGRSMPLKAGLANSLKPGKRPVNTIHAYAVTTEHGLSFSGGTPGGDGQVQWNAATLAAALVDGMRLEQAAHAPRFTCFPGADLIEAGEEGRIELESGLTAEREELESLGHTVKIRDRVQGSIRIAERVDGGWIAHHDGHDDGSSIGTAQGWER
ncbi:gamma-glutamyltransferase [Sphingomonas panacis]|uniref:gamma-glutamyltransferase n=1 Tax=Sphingomonas panacis TaxID=1560345 RepID=UPI0009F5810B|nr:gamma-glutamyltransferase [Sphingomonas panacis]